MCQESRYVSPDYFHTIGTRLIAGRDITWTDINKRHKVVFISENFARELWGDPEVALGQRIREWNLQNNPVWREIVGVVEDVREDGPPHKPPAMVYWPVMMENVFGRAIIGTRSVAFVIGTDRAGSESLQSEVRQAVWSVNPDLPVFQLSTMQDLYDRSLSQTSFAMVMLAIAGTMALGLGIIGLYGVISYVVSQRTREIGIRLALGAEPAKLKQMFVRQGLNLAVIGIFAGQTAALALMRFMSSLLFEIDPMDARMYIAVPCLLLTAAAVASYIAARRARRSIQLRL